MATTEDVLSQDFHETGAGTTLLRVFSSTYADYNLGSVTARAVPYSVLTHPFPYRIGDALNYDGLSFPVTTTKTRTMRITDIQLRSIDNVNIKIEVFYSTAIPVVVQEEQPDTNASWQENLSISSIAEQSDIWATGVDGSSAANTVSFGTRWQVGGEQRWSTSWENAGFAAADITPSLLHVPDFTFTVTAYASTLFIRRILDYHLSVNGPITGVAGNSAFSAGWMERYFGSDRVPALADRNGVNLGSFPGSNITDLVGFEDTGRWLFTSCPVSRARFDSWQYDFEFIYNAQWRWNFPNGIQVDKYPQRDFVDLFEGMTNAPEDSNQGGARS